MHTEISFMADVHESPTHPLCLEFSNTVGRHVPDYPEKLRSYADLADWAGQVGILSEQEKAGLLEKSSYNPKEAVKVLEHAIVLREAIFRIFSATAAEGSPADEDLTLLNRGLAQALPHLQLVSAPTGLVWGWDGLTTTLDGLLWPVIRSAAELLTSDQLSRLRECSSKTCNWLFIDQSKNRSRRWCDMSDCGNRAKARRHYHKQKAMGSSA